MRKLNRIITTMTALLFLLLLTACSQKTEIPPSSAPLETQPPLTTKSQPLSSHGTTEEIPNESTTATASTETKGTSSALDLQNREAEIKNGLILPLNNGEPLTAEYNFRIDLVKGRNEKAEWVSIREACYRDGSMGWELYVDGHAMGYSSFWEQSQAAISAPQTAWIDDANFSSQENCKLYLISLDGESIDLAVCGERETMVIHNGWLCRMRGEGKTIEDLKPCRPLAEYVAEGWLLRPVMGDAIDLDGDGKAEKLSVYYSDYGTPYGEMIAVEDSPEGSKEFLECLLHLENIQNGGFRYDYLYYEPNEAGGHHLRGKVSVNGQTYDNSWAFIRQAGAGKWIAQSPSASQQPPETTPTQTTAEKEILLTQSRFISQQDSRWLKQACGKDDSFGTELPDTLGTARGKEDWQEGNCYHIAALDLTLTIPEGFYLYHLPGVYLKVDTPVDYGCVSLEFVDEYILTNQAFEDTETLYHKLVTYYDSSWFQTSFATAPWVVLDWKIFHRNYLPLVGLLESRVHMSPEIRLQGDYCIALGTERQIYAHDETVKAAKEAVKEAVLEATRGNGLPYLHWESINGTFGKGKLFYNLPGNLAQGYKTRHLTLMNDLWWNTFSDAVKRLTEEPERYAYPPVKLNIKGFDVEEWVENTPGDWYMDSEKDVILRAYVYTLMVMAGKGGELDLQNKRICLKDSENDCALYLALWAQSEERKDYKLVQHGVDFTLLSDFDFAREYAEQYMMGDR